MSSTQNPVIVVLGATGAQGGSVVQYLLDDPAHSFRVRGVTRNVESPKAKDLAKRGVEVVNADLNDPESLRKAFEGAYGVFGVTNFWEGASEEKESAQGKALVDAALATGVKHFVWSTLDHTTDPEVPHWNSKAAVDDYLKEKKVPRTSLYTSFYYENFIEFPILAIKKTEDGRLVADWPLVLSDGPIGGYSVTETGAYALEAFKKPQEWIGKDMRVISDVFTPNEFIQALSEVTGKKVDLVQTDRARFDSTKDSAHELWANMEHFYKNNGNPNRDLELTRRINPSRKTFRGFIEANKKVFIASFGA